MTHVHGRRRRLVCVALLLSLLLVSIPAQATLYWQTSTVDSTDDAGYSPSLVLDASGNPHVSYRAYDGTSDLRYAAWNGSSWDIESVDYSNDVGFFSSLALDASGHPHISYYDATFQALKYAVNDGSGWDIETIDNVGDTGLFSSLALDAAGHPHISYYDQTNSDLRYAVNDGSSWTLETVDAVDQSGWYSSIAIDSVGHPHIAYLNAFLDGLRYASNTGGGWTSEVIDANATSGAERNVSLVLDSGDNPHVSYYDDDAHVDINNNIIPGGLKYAVKTGGSWSIEHVDPPSGWGKGSSLALDSSGNPHISYLVSDTGTSDDGVLKYASWTGSDWDIITVDKSGTIGSETSLRLDASGFAHISYFDYGADDLKYAVQADDSTAPTTTATAVNFDTAPYTFGTWTNQRVTVTLSPSDTGGSGLDSTFYVLDSGYQQTYSGAIWINTESANHYLVFWSTDKAGNTETSHAVIVRIDWTDPTITYSGNQGTYMVDETVAITCAADDALSGLASSDCADINGPAVSFGLGSHTVSNTAADNAGNVGTGSVIFTVDVDPASLSNLTEQYASNPWIGRRLVSPLGLAQWAEQMGNPRLEAYAVNSYVMLVNMQRGRSLTNAEADTLITLARAL